MINSGGTLEQRNFDESIGENTLDGSDASVTGWTENWEVNLAAGIQSEMSISKHIMQAPMRAQKDKLREMVHKKEFSEAELEQFRFGGGEDGIYWDKLADYASTREDMDVLSTADMQEEIYATVRQTEADRAQKGRRAGVMGTLGAFAGGMHSGMLDPPNILASLAIPGAGVGATMMQSVGKSAGLGMAGNLAAEAMISPTVYDWKNEAGLDYTFGDAMLNLGISTAAGGALGAATGAIGHGIRQKKWNKAVKEMRDQIDPTFGNEQWSFSNAVDADMTLMNKELDENPVPTQTHQQMDKEIGDTGYETDTGQRTGEPEVYEETNIQEALAETRSMFPEETEAPKAKEDGPAPEPTPENIELGNEKIKAEGNKTFKSIAQENERKRMRAQEIMSCFRG